MKSVEEKVVDRIMKVQKGKLIFPEDFQSPGTRYFLSNGLDTENNAKSTLMF